jgi:glycosyltransferase involved in cell wall biosynthesis
MQQGISIALCTYNGSQRIENTLLSILAQEGIDISKFELLIVDNASTDNTADVCRDVLENEKFSGSYRIIAEPKPGAINARLKALKEAKFKWLLICDDDNILDKNYLSTGLSILESEKKIGALGGKGIASFEIDKPVWFDKYHSSYAVGEQNINSGKLEKHNAALYGAGTFFNKDILTLIFETSFKTVMIGPNQKNLTRGEDTEWCYLLKLLDYEIWYDSNLSFIHHFNKERLTWNYYLNLKKGIASGAGLLYSYHFLLKNKKGTINNYFAKYFQETIKFSLLYLKLSLGHKLEKNKSYETELGFVIVKYKLKSFLYNFIKSYKNLYSIKKLIININTQ